MAAVNGGAFKVDGAEGVRVEYGCEQRWDEMGRDATEMGNCTRNDCQRIMGSSFEDRLERHEDCLEKTATRWDDWGYIILRTGQNVGEADPRFLVAGLT